MSRSLKIGFAGTGFIGRRHLRNLLTAERSLRLATPEGDRIIECGQNGFNTSLTHEYAMREFLDAVRGGPQTSNPLQTGLPSNALALTAKDIAC